MRGNYPWVQYNTDVFDQEVSISDVIEYYTGINVSNVRGNIRCPSPKHNDKNPSAAVYADENICHCYGCKMHIGPFNLARMYEPDKYFPDFCYEFAQRFNVPLERCSDIEERQNAKNTSDYKPSFLEKFPLTSKDFETLGVNTNDSQNKGEAPKEENVMPYVMRCKTHINQTDYHRGLSAKTLDHFNIGFDPTYKCVFGTQPRMIIPTSDHSFLARLAISFEDKDYEKSIKCHKRGPSEIFNSAVLFKGEPVIIVEGEIDAMSIYEIGENGLGIGGVGNVNKLLKMISDNNINIPFVIAMDDDEKGNEARDALVRGFDKLGVTYVAVSPNFFGGCKDANEMLISDREGLKENVHNAMVCASRLKRKNNLKPKNVAKAEEAVKCIKGDTPAWLSSSLRADWTSGDRFKKTEIEQALIKTINNKIASWQNLGQECDKSCQMLSAKYAPQQWKYALQLYDIYIKEVKEAPTLKPQYSAEQFNMIRDAAAYRLSYDAGMNANAKIQDLTMIRDKITTQLSARENFYEEYGTELLKKYEVMQDSGELFLNYKKEVTETSFNDLHVQNEYGEVSINSDVLSVNHVSFSERTKGIEEGTLWGLEKLGSVTIYPSTSYIGENVFAEYPDITIYCVKGSYADKYAYTHNLKTEYFELEKSKKSSYQRN